MALYWYTLVKTNPITKNSTYKSFWKKTFLLIGKKFVCSCLEIWYMGTNLKIISTKCFFFLQTKNSTLLLLTGIDETDAFWCKNCLILSWRYFTWKWYTTKVKVHRTNSSITLLKKWNFWIKKCKKNYRNWSLPFIVSCFKLRITGPKSSSLVK